MSRLSRVVALLVVLCAAASVCAAETRRLDLLTAQERLCRTYGQMAFEVVELRNQGFLVSDSLVYVRMLAEVKAAYRYYLPIYEDLILYVYTYNRSFPAVVRKEVEIDCLTAVSPWPRPTEVSQGHRTKARAPR